ncbi:hypothetical protein GCM10025781_11090 [Kocuria gwangalliensis]|uniref:Uncharacterized protein n=1 Tax=Kocuria gwangalliensis TaxID=501592 RepID=A0ABP8WTB1_9MICC
MTIHTGPNEDPKYPPYHPTLVAHRDAYKLARAHLTRDQEAITAILSHPIYTNDPDATARLILALTRHLADALTSLGMDNAADPVNLLDLALTEVDMVPFRTDLDAPGEDG